MTQSPTFGPILRQMRKRAGMTQSDLAAAVGYSVSYISSLEQSSRLPDVTTVVNGFVPALGLQDEPRLAARLVEQAAACRGVAPPPPPAPARPGRMAHTPAPWPALPTPPSPLLGRDEELRALCNRLLGHSGRLMTLLGPPGIGKSRLALEIAIRLQSAWRDGAAFVALAPLDDPAHLPSALARALHLAVDPGSAIAARLIGHLRRKEMLLVLDNFEQIIPAASFVAELLAECPGLRLLVTSRERLHLRVEQRVRVAPLAPGPAAELFIQRAQAAQTDFALPSGDEPTIAAICRRLDYLPLALELSAARMDLLSPRQLLEKLEESRLALLSDGPQELPPHQRALAAAIQRSYRLLTPHEQRLFRRLGVFASSFDEEAAAALGVDLAGLRLLAAHSLLQVETANGANRYRLLETLREFAGERLREAGEEEEVRLRQVGWLLSLARRADGAMRTGGRLHWLARLDQEMDNLRGGLAWAVQHAPGLALALAGLLQEFWYSRGYNDEGQEWLGRALAAAPQPTPDRVRALNALGQLQTQQSDLAAGQASLAAGVALARALDDLPRLAEGLRLAGWTAYDSHDRDATLAFFHESLALFRRLGERLGEADVLTSLAHVEVLSTQADRAQVRGWLEEALAVYRVAGDLPGPVFALQQLGQLAAMEEEYPAAVLFFEEALGLARALGQRPQIAWGLELLGEAHWLAGDVEQAAGCWQEALGEFHFLGSREAVAFTEHHLGQVARRRGEWERAAALYASSLAANQELGNRHMTARCLAGLGAVALAQGDRAEAVRLLGEAQAIFSQLAPFLPPGDARELAALYEAVSPSGGR